MKRKVYAEGEDPLARDCPLKKNRKSHCFVGKDKGHILKEVRNGRSGHIAKGSAGQFRMLGGQG